MRLTSDEIEYISRKIVKTLTAAGKLELDSGPRVIEAIGKVITEEMMVRTASTKRSAKSSSSTPRRWSA